MSRLRLSLSASGPLAVDVLVAGEPVDDPGAATIVVQTSGRGTPGQVMCRRKHWCIAGVMAGRVNRIIEMVSICNV